MATTKMSSDVLDVLNDIYNRKEQAGDVANLFGNLVTSCGWSNGSTRKLATIEYDSQNNRKIINEEEVPDELRKRLISCAQEYYEEQRKLFESFTVTGDILVDMEE